MLTRIWNKSNSNELLVGMQNDTVTLEDSWQFLTNPNTVFCEHLAIMLLGTDSVELKT